MATALSYIVFLSPPLSSPQHIQQIANLPQTPPARPVAEDGPDEEEIQLDNGDEERVTSCCIVDSSTKEAIIDWAQSTAQKIKPIIPIIPTEPASTSNALREQYPVPYFVYGQAASRVFLENLLELDLTPSLPNATINGYKVKRWRDHLALLEAPGSTAAGKVYMVESEGQVEQLAEWLGFAFEVSQCSIKVDDGRQVEGNTFVCWWDKGELEDIG